MKEVDPALPGADLVSEGLKDLAEGRRSASALLVSIGAPRLSRLGFSIPHPLPDPEHALFELLGREHGNSAHSQYNALIRRLVSFERAAECADS